MSFSINCVLYLLEEAVIAGLDESTYSVSYRGPFHQWYYFHRDTNFVLLFQIPIKWSQQKFAHDTAAVLPWHVQNFVVVLLSWIDLRKDNFSIAFKLQMKYR